jgi:predicted amidohydrolase YtcJ
VKTTFPFRSLLDRGVTLAIGTDWPVAPLDPRLTLYAAVTRATLDGRHPDGWVPEQKIALADAVAGYTRQAAFAEFAEREKGSIEPGKLADLVVLGEDIFSLPADAIRYVPVEATIVGGRVVYGGVPWGTLGH